MWIKPTGKWVKTRFKIFLQYAVWSMDLYPRRYVNRGSTVILYQGRQNQIIKRATSTFHYAFSGQGCSTNEEDCSDIKTS